MSIVSKASSLLAELTLEEKASLCLGADFWHTAAVERLGIPAIMVSDGPHGLRTQPEEGDHVAISGSVPATCNFPISTLAAFPGLGLSHPVVHDLIGQRLPHGSASLPSDGDVDER